MKSVTNNTRQAVALVTGVKDGVATVEDVRPGETKNVAVREDDPHYQGLLHAQAITVGEAKRGRQPAPSDT